MLVQSMPLVEDSHLSTLPRMSLESVMFPLLLPAHTDAFPLVLPPYEVGTTVMVTAVEAAAGQGEF